eukprot:2314469-Rhodomonas_salina.2
MCNVRDSEPRGLMPRQKARLSTCSGCPGRSVVTMLSSDGRQQSQQDMSMQSLNGARMQRTAESRGG